ncbi:hypothetical protein [uncultured Roseibium sp.]|uniref:putative PDDEXK endonuclease n=1 Tax=uncultured Roseibium sp. TaxID=1936171 RepID=UPI0026360C49|nr:hypothetical protein [uncultured Roseibium sp.]
MGKFSRDKGARFERDVVNILRAHGLRADRVPLSGAVDGFGKDVRLIDHNEVALTVECKKRADGQKQIRKWIEEADLLVLGADRQEALVVLRLKDFCELQAEAGQVLPTEESAA